MGAARIRGDAGVALSLEHAARISGHAGPGRGGDAGDAIAVAGCHGGFPDKENPLYPASALKPTAYDLITGYNNFYEFGTDKGDPRLNANQGWKPEPWTVEIGRPGQQSGEMGCERPGREKWAGSSSGSTAIAASRRGRW